MRVRGSKKPKASETKTENAAELSAAFDRALAMLGGEALMSSVERQRGLKFPAGGERIAELLLQVAEQHGVTPPPHSKIDPEDIRARLRAAAELRPVAARAAIVEAAVSDRLRTNERAAWEPTLALYRLLQALAVSDAGIELSLAPIQELFASRKAKKTDSSSPDAEEVTIDKTGLATTTIQRSTQRAPGAFEPAKSGLSSFVPARALGAPGPGSRGSARWTPGGGRRPSRRARALHPCGGAADDEDGAVSSAPTPFRLAVLVASAGLLASCAREEPPGASKLPGEAEARASSSTPIGSAAPAASASASAAASAVPPEDSLPIGPEYVVEDGAGVPIAALANPTYVYDLPDFSKRKLGYARPGAILHRAEKPVRTPREPGRVDPSCRPPAKDCGSTGRLVDRCKDGWYRVAPRGFVCQNAEWTTDLSHPLVQALAKKPRRGSPLPYIYGRSRAHPPHYYVRVPARSQQRQAEGGVELAEHLDQASRSNAIAVTGQPDPLPPGLVPGQALPRPVNLWYKARSGATRGVANPRSSFAFFSVHDVEGRLFGLSTDFDMIAIDRVRLVTETRIHGGPVADLPAGIARNGTPRYRRDEGGKVTLDGAYEPFTALSLTGKTEGDLAETSEGTWVSPRALLPFAKRTSFPGWVTGGEKWVDVSIRDQTLVAYEGKRAVYVTQVSTGAGGDGDPETTSATIQGYFRIQAKHVTATMTGNRADVTEYELSDVPYVQYFHGGYALHAAFWHEKFGHPHSHGCVNLTPRDAAWLFEWTEPQVPEEWHGIEANGQGTLVYVH